MSLWRKVYRVVLPTMRIPSKRKRPTICSGDHCCCRIICSTSCHTLEENLREKGLLITTDNHISPKEREFIMSAFSFTLSIRKAPFGVLLSLILVPYSSNTILGSIIYFKMVLLISSATFSKSGKIKER